MLVKTRCRENFINYLGGRKCQEAKNHCSIISPEICFWNTLYIDILQIRKYVYCYRNLFKKRCIINVNKCQLRDQF